MLDDINIPFLLFLRPNAQVSPNAESRSVRDGLLRKTEGKLHKEKGKGVMENGIRLVESLLDLM
jgi:hypothetical protein